MSEASQTTIVPEWTLGDRMGKALSVAGISVGDMSDYLGLSRNTVSAYINDRQPVKRQTLLLWAMRTNVSVEWLTLGVTQDGSPTPPDRPRGVRDEAALARLAAKKRPRNTGAPNTDTYLPSVA